VLTDPLTGLGNQRRFVDKVERLKADRAEDPAPFAIGIIDLDGFKPINDLFGRSAGDDILTQADGLDVRIDPRRVAVVGHSWGAQTAGALLGARVFDADGNPGEDFTHPAARAGVLIAATGTGESLTPFAVEHLPFMRPDYSTMTTPALIIAGGKDQSAMSTRGPDWFTDAYHLSPVPKGLLTITEGEHTLGGIAGEKVAETTDEDPARVALVADAVAAYLLDAFDLDDGAWATLRRQAAASDGACRIEGK